MVRLLSVPHLGTAEEDVLLLEWRVPPGHDFHRGQILVVLETLKASFEIEAEDDGRMCAHLAEEGTRLQVGAPLAALAAPGEVASASDWAHLVDEVGAPPTGEEDVPLAEPTAPRSAGGGGAAVPAAPAARRRAAELGVDLAACTGSGPGGLIRVEDVEAAARAPVDAGGDGDRGRLDPGFVARLRTEGGAFARLSSSFRLDQYRRHGADVGPDCVLGPGSLLVCERLVLGAGTRLGRDVRVEASSFETGPGTGIGDRSSLRARVLRLGANAYLAPDVEVGGGGAMDPEARCEIGSHGFVGERVHLNPCRPLRIGDEVVVSRGAVVMTHSFGLDALAGYPSRFAGVTIDDGCQVGINAVLFPGVHMGRGSILLSGSSLIGDLPPGRLWGGVPARDLKAAARPLAEDERLELLLAICAEFARQLELRGLELGTRREGTRLVLDVDRDGDRHRMIVDLQLPLEEHDLVAEDLRVGLRVDEARWAALPAELCAMDLGRKRLAGRPGPLGEAFREWLRKHGVRLAPRTWTYRGGWL
ncbi:MAG: E3 binding domain-containing protein [Planctomycetota bacterium]